MKLSTFFMVTLLLWGCGAEYSTGEFEPYVQKFRAYARECNHNVNTSKLVIKWGDLNTPVIDDGTKPRVEGTCFKPVLPWASPTIVIDRTDWKQYTDDEHEELLMHELGHCILGREHNPREIASVPESIMYPHMFRGDIYEANLTHYIEELFQ